MKKIKKYTKTGITFLVMATATICSGYHFRWPTNASALTSFRVDLTQGGDNTVIVDLGAQSWPKYLLQPGRLRVSGQLKAPSDLVDRQASLLITIASSKEKISVRPSARNMTVTDHGYSYEVSLNSSPKPSPGRRGQAQAQEQVQAQAQGLNPKPNPDREQDSVPQPKPKPDRLGLGQEQSQRQEEQGLNPKPKTNPKPKPGRRPGRGLEPGVVPLSFELSIPYMDTIKRDIGSVIVRYTDNEQGSLQGQVTFIIRNSRIGAK